MVRVNIRTVRRGDLDFHATRKDIDWHDRSDRRWLESHIHHCMMNNKVVTLTPLPESN